MIQYLPLRSGLRVLEYGCGEGVLFDQWAGWAGALYGVDRSASRLRYAGPIAVSDGRLPFARETFDAVLGQNALRSAADLGAANLDAAKGALDAGDVLSELARVLRPGGRLILWERIQDIQERIQNIRTWRLYRLIGVDQLALLGRAAGLTLVTQEPFDRLAYPAALWMAKVPWLRRSYLGMTLLQGMFALDALLARLFDASWHVISVWEKRHV
jgi:SAM-dependent methyltransferase